MRHGENCSQQDNVLWLQPGSNQAQSLAPDYRLSSLIKIFQLTPQMAITCEEFGKTRKLISSKSQENCLKQWKIYQKPCENTQKWCILTVFRDFESEIFIF